MSVEGDCLAHLVGKGEGHLGSKTIVGLGSVAFRVVSLGWGGQVLCSVRSSWNFSLLQAFLALLEACNLAMGHNTHLGNTKATASKAHLNAAAL